MTKAEERKRLVRGLKVTLSDGKPGIFLRHCKTGGLAEVLRGGYGGKLDTDTVAGILHRTFNTEEKK